jgi:DNA-binding NarL/FixJ family response regulator
MTISLLLIDDNSIFRQELFNFLNTIPEIQVIAVADSRPQGLVLVKTLHPDVVIMDWLLPTSGGIKTAVDQILAHHPQTRIIILSAHNQQVFISMSISAGVWGYILKEDTRHHLKKAIFSVASGKKYFSPKLLDSFKHTPDRKNEC